MPLLTPLEARERFVQLGDEHDLDVRVLPVYWGMQWLFPPEPGAEHEGGMGPQPRPQSKPQPNAKAAWGSGTPKSSARSIPFPPGGVPAWLNPRVAGRSLLRVRNGLEP